ncbi:MAG: dNTP triphosphohydrolase [Myxococcales bacterium]
MDWSQLLSARRLRRVSASGEEEAARARTRSPFQQDADLIVFSAAFRRLQDKTQVQPLSETGRVRTRLTHSIEVASVGRSLGSSVASVLADRRGLNWEQVHAMASAVHAACLAHDIGNPPFGHGGEDAIQGWFLAHPAVLAGLSEAEAAGLLAFDGNAQGFRILTALENYRFDGGLRLTEATLGAFMKYRVGPLEREPGSSTLALRKAGFFESERAYAEELAGGLGLPAGRRHPLVYLTEAADDICYAIVDLEDGFDAGLLEHAAALEVLSELADCPPPSRLGRAEQLHKLRALAIGRMVDAVSEVFLDVEPNLLAGESVGELCLLTKLGPGVLRAKELARERIFSAPSVVERLLGGQRVLATLLDNLVPVAEALRQVGFERSALAGRARLVAHLLGEHYEPRTSYEALLGITDFLSGLTDRAALALALRITGEA